VILDYFVLFSRHGGQKKQIFYRFGDGPSIFELGTFVIKLDTRPMSCVVENSYVCLIFAA
jgi:hypothetical protein